MGMATCGSYAECIEKELLEKLCPLEYRIFMDTLKASNVTFDNFCQVVYEGFDEAFDDGTEEQAEAVFDAYEKLQTAFVVITALALEVVYNEKDDRGDDLDGGSFSVDGVYQLTPAGEKFQDSIRRKWWTTCG